MDGVWRRPEPWRVNELVRYEHVRYGGGMSQSNAHAAGRRERPAKPALTREGVVGAAIEIMEAEGLDKVTMRRVAASLDTGPASLYVYVRSVADLHTAILDQLLGGLERGNGAGQGARWRERLVRRLTAYTQLLFHHPALARSILVLRPSGPHYLRLAEDVLTDLLEGGATDSAAAWGLDILFLYATSTAAEHGTRDAAASGAGAGAGADQDSALFTAIRQASPAEFPNVAELGPELLSGSGAERLEWGFDVLLTGIMGDPGPRRKHA
jgi:AcrR family transcriptional regulator